MHIVWKNFAQAIVIFFLMQSQKLQLQRGYFGIAMPPKWWKIFSAHSFTWCESIIVFSRQRKFQWINTMLVSTNDFIVAFFCSILATSSNTTFETFTTFDWLVRISWWAIVWLTDNCNSSKSFNCCNRPNVWWISFSFLRTYKNLTKHNSKVQGDSIQAQVLQGGADPF